MPEEDSSPNEGAGSGGEAVGGGTPPVVDGSAATTTEKEEGREKWFIEMRGWVMVLAVPVAAFTYQAGLNPPSRFSDPPSPSPSPSSTKADEKSTGPFRYKVFSNTTAFLTSLAIIILMMNRSFSSSLVKVTVLEIIVVLDMIGLMAAYWAGSTTGKNQTNLYAVVLTALVLFVIYVVYAVQLVQNLYAVPPVRKLLWGLFDAVWRRRVPEPARAATRDDGDGTAAVPNQQGIDDGTRAPPPLDVGRSKSELRRRDSRLVARTPGTGKSTMLSP